MDWVAKELERYRFLSDNSFNSISISRNDDHSCNYMTASAWIDKHPDQFDDCSPDEISQMRETNTIWTLQVYPNTPVGSNVWYGPTMESVIDSAIKYFKEVKRD